MSYDLKAIQAIYNLPLPELMYRAQTVHRANHDASAVQLCTLKSIKTGRCQEDCKYCPQSAHYSTGLEPEPLMDTDSILSSAQDALKQGASRFCMGAAWRAPKDRDIEKMSELVSAVKGLGLQTCATLGMLAPHQATALRDAGLDYYNHNLDTAPEYYTEVVDTRSYQDRLDTLKNVRAAGISVCCGGIVGMGESRQQRAAFLARLANLSPYPESVPINHLVPVAGTPLAEQKPLDPLEFVRTIAVARITMPKARVRLSAGRQELGRAVQAMCFMAGANSIFYGEQLLTTGNPEAEQDRELLAELGLKTKQSCKAEVLV